jgi:hypothetical protein
MAKGKEAPPAELKNAVGLQQEIAAIWEQMRVLIDVLNEIREELDWVTRNGLPQPEPRSPVPVLKEMALDPMSDAWNDRLQIIRNEPGERGVAMQVHPQPAPPKAPAGQLFSKPGDQGRLF